MNYLKIESQDLKDEKTLSLTVAEMKVIYNHFLEVLEDFPEMMTFQSTLDKLKEKIDDDCDCDYFYGVNHINQIDWMYGQDKDDVEITLDLEVQSTITEEPQDMVLFFTVSQIEHILETNKKMRKRYK